MTKRARRSGSSAQRALRLPAVADAPLLRPLGAGAVMASRAAVGEDDAIGQLDYFPTPPWAARAGGELIGRLDPRARESLCWEPACGGGHMAFGLRDAFDGVLITDIHDHGVPHEAGGPLDADWSVGDFLDPDFRGAARHPDWIVTNPPFVAGEAFVDRALALATRGVAMLLRLQFRESVGRQRLFGGHPDWVGMATFADRVPMQKGSWNPDLRTATAYAWFIWMKPRAVGPSPMAAAIGAARSVGCGLDMTIEAGARERFSRPIDRVLFAGGAAQGDLLTDDDASAARADSSAAVTA